MLALASYTTLHDKIACVTIMTMTADVGRGEDRKSIARELRRGSLELIVLHLLGVGEAYGYEIVSKLVAQTGGALEVTDGTLYPVLYRLERAGFLSVRWETQERGVPRKYYRLTDSGRDELAQLTSEWTTFANAMAALLTPTSEGT
jgi:PadR family transcriptional regulator PadR